MDAEIEERTSNCDKCVKKFNPYAQYGVEHWKNPHAKIFYIKRQKEPGKPKEVVYLNSKIIQVFQEVPGTGHEHKFISQRYGKKEPIITVSITESDYKNLNKNDIEDMYLLIMNGKVPDYAETCLMWSLSVFIRSSVIWERVRYPTWNRKLSTEIAHTGSSSRNTSSYYVTHPTSVVDYDDEYQQDDVQTNSEDPLASAMLLLARAITQKFSNPTNNRLRTSSNTRNQAIIQGDKGKIQQQDSGNTGRNTRRAYVQEEVVEGSNAQNETGNVQRTLRTSSSGNTSTVQCYNCSGKGHYARNCPKPRVRDSKYFMEQMLLAKQDEAGVLLTDEQKSFSLMMLQDGRNNENSINKHRLNCKSNHQ
ncbi:gag-pol polyprotein [Tanacetum coccineum]